MLLLGILSTLQITLLPGLIVFHFLKLKTESPIQKYLYIFSLSLFINYSLVTALVLLKLYTIVTLWVVIVFELLLLAYLIIKRKITLNINYNFGSAVENYVSLFMTFPSYINIIVGLASIVILFYIALFLSNLGTIFYFIDTVNLIHWNTWAKDLANNTLPIQSSHFPQLIPANWSVCYVLTGNSDINFFAKSIMPLFFLGNLLILLDLAVWKKNYLYLIGLIIYGLFGPIIFPLVFIADGNADLPVSFFAFLTFYSYLRLSKDKFELGERLLFFLFAATTAATKLAGFYIFLFASLISLIGFIKYFRQIDRSKILILLILLPIILAFSLFWHFLKPVTMVSGLHQPEYVGQNYISIFINAAKLMYFNWGLPVLTFFIITIIASLFVKNIRYVTLIMVIPPLILWMLKYSADFRNLSFVVPFLCYVAAFGLFKIIEIIKKRSLRPDMGFYNSNESTFKSKEKILGGVISVVCLAVFFTIQSDFFFDVLFQVHKFLSKYYFQSYRINFLIDYSQLVSVDYYQNVFAIMFLIIPFIYIVSITKLKLYQLMTIIVLSALLLNFTYMKRENIIANQVEQTNRVEARNYASWINAIIESARLDKKVYTNFKSLSSEKIPGNTEFIFIDDSQIEKLLFCQNCDYLFLLKIETLQKRLTTMINEKLSLINYEILFNDSTYMLINKKPF
jgi:cell division protein FtsL